jgi:hypothetical protein
MKSINRIGSGFAACGLALASFAALADTATNTMTSVATVTDACDIVAVGLDFGVTSMPIPSAGIISTTPNTSVGNAVTGNTMHPYAADDGGADDTLTLNTPDATTTTLISAVLGAISTAASGVFVACTTTPTAITVTSGAGGSTPYSLPTTLGGSPVSSFSGKMSGVGGGAAGSNQLDYTLTFVGAPVSTAIVGGLPVTLFTAAFVATGMVPAAQSGTIVPGFYADVATAQVDF